MFADAEFIPEARESGFEKWSMPDPAEFIHSLNRACDRESERIYTRVLHLLRWFALSKEKIA